MSDTTHDSDRSYVIIWGILLGALAVSLVLGTINHVAGAVAIFAIAAIKAGIVIARFMHLRIEPRWIKVTMLGAVLVLAVMFLGLTPDIIYVFGHR